MVGVSSVCIYCVLHPEIRRAVRNFYFPCLSDFKKQLVEKPRRFEERSYRNIFVSTRVSPISHVSLLKLLQSLRLVKYATLFYASIKDNCTQCFLVNRFIIFKFHHAKNGSF